MTYRIQMQVTLNVGLYHGNDASKRNNLDTVELVVKDAFEAQGFEYTPKVQLQVASSGEPTAVLKGVITAEQGSIHKVRIAIAIAAVHLKQDAIAFRFGSTGHMVHCTKAAIAAYGDFKEEYFLDFEEPNQD